MKTILQKNTNAIKIEIKSTSGRVYYTAEYDQQNDWVYGNWIGYVTIDEVKEAANTYLSILQETRCPHLLNNNRQLLGTWDKANEWIEKEWTPKALANGLKNFAHVVSPSIFAELSAKNLEVRVENIGFTMRTFKESSDAATWLKQQQKK
jgi:hypothetical protein